VEKDLWRIEHAMDPGKTKPILAWPRWAGAGNAVGTAGRAGCTNKANSRAQSCRWPVPPGPIAPNEANFPQQAGPGRGQSCETKPISRWRISDCGLGPGLRRDAPCGLSPQRANCAKQSQFPGGAGWDEAPEARGGGQMCETNPISRLRISDFGLRIGHSPAGGRLPCGRSPLARAGRSCETNPISPVGQGLGGRNVQNEAKLAQDGESGGRRAGELPIVQNEANLARPGQGRVPEG
jgi:hypothetical protein